LPDKTDVAPLGRTILSLANSEGLCIVTIARSEFSSLPILHEEKSPNFLQWPRITMLVSTHLHTKKSFFKKNNGPNDNGKPPLQMYSQLAYNEI